MKTLPETILERSKELAEGQLLEPKEFLHVASRAAVDKAFSRLAKRGQLLRISRGLYVAPVATRFGIRAPAAQMVINDLAYKRSETIARNGAWAANALGLTTQMPVQQKFVGSGRSRTLQLGKVKITVEHAPSWQLVFGTTPTGDAIRALAWMGQAHASETTAKLRKHLTDSEWKVLESARGLFPSWIAEAIGRETDQHSN